MSVRKRGEMREDTRTIEGKKEKNCEFGVFGRTLDFNIFINRTL